MSTPATLMDAINDYLAKQRVFSETDHQSKEDHDRDEAAFLAAIHPIEEWASPAQSQDEALAALRLTVQEYDDGCDGMAEPLVRAALAYLEAQSTVSPELAGLLAQYPALRDAANAAEGRPEEDGICEDWFHCNEKIIEAPIRTQADVWAKARAIASHLKEDKLCGMGERGDVADMVFRQIAAVAPDVDAKPSELMKLARAAASAHDAVEAVYHRCEDFEDSPEEAALDAIRATVRQIDPQTPTELLAKILILSDWGMSYIDFHGNDDLFDAMMAFTGADRPATHQKLRERRAQS